MRELLYNPDFELVPVDRIFAHAGEFKSEQTHDDKGGKGGKEGKEGREGREGDGEFETHNRGGMTHMFDETVSILKQAFWDAVYDQMRSHTYDGVYSLLRELQEGIADLCDINVHTAFDARHQIEALANQSSPEGDSSAFHVAGFVHVATKLFDGWCCCANRARTVF